MSCSLPTTRKNDPRRPWHLLMPHCILPVQWILPPSLENDQMYLYSRDRRIPYLEPIRLRWMVRRWMVRRWMVHRWMVHRWMGKVNEVQLVHCDVRDKLDLVLLEFIQVIGCLFLINSWFSPPVYFQNPIFFLITINQSYSPCQYNCFKRILVPSFFQSF